MSVVSPSDRLLAGYFLGFQKQPYVYTTGEDLGILEEVVEIMSCCRISARKLARVTGRIISNFLIMGDVCKLMTKSLHRLIACRRGWDAQLVLDADVLLELKVLERAFTEFKL